MEAYATIRALIAVIRILDSVIDAIARNQDEKSAEELRVLVAESRIARSREERVDASKKLRDHFRNRSS